MSSGGTNTSTTQSGPPQQFLDAYTAINQRAQQVAATPNQSYPYQTIAPFTPDQATAFGNIQDLTANGGVQQPYLQQAQNYLSAAQAPLIDSIPTLSDDQLVGTAQFGLASLGSAANYGGMTAAGQTFNPSTISQFESPYTQQVVDATQAQFNNQNSIAQNQLAGNAASAGAFGGDRQAVAQAVLAGQQQANQAPVIAGLRNAGYQNATQAAQQQAALGLQGAGLQASTAAQQLGAFGSQQGTELGANQANAWLASQGAAGEANLGSLALASGLQGSAALLQSGALQQQMAQQNLNVPYQQWLAAQAYPFQTAGWLANIAEGLGSSSGGIGSTTSPSPSVGSQIAGAGAAGVGVLGATNAFGSNGNPGWLSGIGSGGGGAAASIPYETGAYIPAASAADSFVARGGAIGRAAGGMVPSVPLTGSDTPDLSVSVVPTDPSKKGSFNLNTSTGSTTTQSGGGDSALGSILKTAGTVAATIYGGPAGGMAANALGSQVHFNAGGMVPVAAKGMSIGEEFPSWARSEESQSLSRHGLLASPIAGRTDEMAISPASGSYVIPADVVSGLGEGNTLAGANVMQRILDTGPHGLKMPHTSFGKGPPRAPPAYVESGIETNHPMGSFADGGAPDGGDDDMPVPPIPPAMGPEGPGNGPMAGGMQPAPLAPEPPSKFREAKADPWLALADAGFATMAGRSPNALQNIGAGALQGVRAYQQDKQEAQKENLTGQQIQNTKDYQTGELGLRGKQIEQTGDLAKATLAQNQALEQARQAQALMIARMHIGMEGANLAETRRYHDETLGQGKYTWASGVGPDPDDPTKQVAGMYRLPTKGDEKPTFISGQTLTARGPAGGGAAMPPDVTNMLAQRVMAGDTSALAGLGYGTAGARARLDVNTEVTRQLAAKGLTGADLAAQVSNYMGEKAGARTAGTREANVAMAVNEAENFMPLALDASAKVNRTQFPTLNSILQAYDKGTGDENIVRLAVATNSLTNAYSRAITPSGIPTEGNQTRARELLDKAWSQGQYSTAVDQLHKEMVAAKASPIQVRKEQSDRISGRTTAPAVAPMPQPTPGAQGAPATWKHNAVGPGGVTIHSNDGSSWFLPDGQPYGAP